MWSGRGRFPPQVRLPPRPTASSAVVVAAWCAFAAYLVVQARLGPVLIWSDSKVYATMAAAPLWSRALWAGARPPLTPLVLKVAGGPSAMVTIQAVVAALAWGALAWTVGRLVEPGWRRTAATLLILGFATTLPITQWNRSELSESLSLSLLALVVAGFIWVSRRLTWPRIAFTATACLAFAMTRDAQVWTVGFLALATAAFALTRVRSHPSAAMRAGVLAGCLVGAVALCEWGTLSSQRTTSNTADVLLVRVFPFPDRVAWFAAHGMPEAGRIDQMARQATATPGSAKVVGIPLSDPTFAPLDRWLRTEGGHTYLLWLVTHPWYVVSEPLVRPERAFNFAGGDLSFYAATTHTARSPLTTVLWPPLVVLLIVAAVALSLGITSEATRTDPWRMMVVLTLIGVGAMLVAWHGDGQETTRHTVEGFAEVRLGVWILFVTGLFALPVFDRATPAAKATEGEPGPTPPAPPRPGGPPSVSDRPSGVATRCR